MPVESRPSAATISWKSRASGVAGIVCLVLGALVSLAGVLQCQFGILASREWRLQAASEIEIQGKAYKCKLPVWGRGALAERRVILLRDGKPVGTKVPVLRTVVERGGGAFRIQQSNFCFSLPRNEDPRPQFSRLSLLLPRQVRSVVWITGGVLLVLGGYLVGRSASARQHLNEIGKKLEAMPDAALITVVLILSLITSFIHIQGAMSLTDGWFSTKGVPYSDSHGWNELAINLADGFGFSGGFSAQRPLYPAMLSLLYAFTGESLQVAHMLNAFWLALAATAVCVLGILGGSRVAGLAGAVGVLCNLDYIHFSKLLLTETSGLAFGVVSVLALAVAIDSPKGWRIILAATLLGLANLAGGFCLLALAGYVAISLITWSARQGVKEAMLQSLVLAGVVAILWTPWLIRQHSVHGFWNLSASSAALMYAAASPEIGSFSEEVGVAARDAGVPNDDGALYRFYMQKYSEAVKAHPLAYGKTILSGMETFADRWRFEGPDHFGVVLLGLIGAALALLLEFRVTAVLTAASVVIALLFLLEGSTAMVIWPLASMLTLATCSRGQRPLWALVAVTAPFVALLCGMVGGSISQRLWTACEWTMSLLLVMGGAGTMRVLGGNIHALISKLNHRGVIPASGKVLPMHRNADMTTMAMLIACLLAAHAVLGCAFATGLYFIKDGRERGYVSLSVEVRQSAHDRAMAQFAFLKPITATDERFWSRPCSFSDYKCSIEAWEDTQHGSRSFEVRPYSRTVAFAQLLNDGGLMACQMRILPGQIPRDIPLLLIGLCNNDPKARLGHDMTMIEVLGWVPMEQGNPSWQKVTWLPFTPEALDVAEGRR